MNKRLIEETFPVKEVSEQSIHEKRIRQGHLSNLHIWWARRPLASSRATAFAALTSAPTNENELKQRQQFIVELSKWENSLNVHLLETARAEILKANNGVAPTVLDPFAGGGAIPLETLRLGCKTYASDLNPVATIIQKATIEYPSVYGKENVRTSPLDKLQDNPLLRDVDRWGAWVLKEAKNELEAFYPLDDQGFFPSGFCWVRTIPCQNPNCGKVIPLKRNWWLYKGDYRRRNESSKKVMLIPDKTSGSVKFHVAGTDYGGIPRDFDPDGGTVSRAIATCLVCGSTVDAKTTRQLFQEGKSGQIMTAVVLQKPGKMGKKFRTATEQDRNVFEAARRLLNEKRGQLAAKWGINPIPDEPTPEGGGSGAERAFSVRNYGFNTWGDLFNPRQQLMLITFAEKVRLAYKEMRAEGYDETYAKVVTTYLGLGIDKLAELSSVLCVLNISDAAVGSTFGRQVLSMVWDYVESNPFNPTALGWPTICKNTSRWVSHASTLPLFDGAIEQASATSVPYADEYFDAVFTDPPYYDNVPYSYLSDFFYVWLKRTLGELYPELFSTPLTPKKNEIVAYTDKITDMGDSARDFELMLRKTLQEIRRVLKPDGILTIVYAHKSTEGWEAMINSLLDSGLVVTGAWPVHTEMGGRLRAFESAALASSIYIIARKMDRLPSGFYNDVKEELKKYLNSKLDRLWKDGIGGADFFIAAIGGAIEVFGKYEKIIDYEGNVIRGDKLLEDTQTIVTDYAARQILHNGFGGTITDLTRFYVLWRWEYGDAKVRFDDARKLAQSCGIDVVQEWSKNGFVKKEREFVRVLGPHLRETESLKGSLELIDVLHLACLLWSKSKREEMLTILSNSGFGSDEAFYRVAQAIGETLPNDSKEKQLLEGFLAGKERIKRDIKNGVGPTTLSDWQ